LIGISISARYFKQKFMNKTPMNQEDDFDAGDLLPEYNFDYTKARPNRFSTTSENKITVILDPDEE
jgi:hypothetical protein